MNFALIVGLLVQNDASITLALRESELAELRRLMRDVRGTDSGRARTRLLKFLIRHLPPEHPVRRAAASDDATLGTPTASVDIDAELERFEALLAAMPPTNEEIIESVRVRLRELPAHHGRIASGRVTEVIVLDGRSPAFQYGADGELLPAVAEVNRVLRPDIDPWAAADWWTQPNGWLGAAPVELLHGVREGDILAAALALGED